VPNDAQLVLLSGGIDSAALLYALPLAPRDCALFINYGQVPEHSERRAARTIARARGVELVEVDASGLRDLGAGHLVERPAAAMPDGGTADQKLEWFPLRNALLLTVAAAFLGKRGGGIVHFGATDPVYRDTQVGFFVALERALQLGLPEAAAVRISWAGANRHKILREALANGLEPTATFSCNTRGDRHCWKCASCRDREALLRENMLGG
jgi:7-cyano-7-deazaguanine synthase